MYVVGWVLEREALWGLVMILWFCPLISLSWFHSSHSRDTCLFSNKVNGKVIAKVWLIAHVISETVRSSVRREQV